MLCWDCNNSIKRSRRYFAAREIDKQDNRNPGEYEDFYYKLEHSHVDTPLEPVVEEET